MAPTLRPPAVAGRFYPARPEELRQLIHAHLAAVPRPASPPAARAWLVPHAGYVYSGPIAAAAFRQVEALRGKRWRVVVAGPSHRVAFAGLAVPEAEYFVTPLGAVPVDREGVAEALRHPGVTTSDRAHALEHSLEVELPFLQEVLGDFTLVPLVVGEASPEQVARVLGALADEKTLVLISSDLSHYLPWEEARHVDRTTLDRVLRLEPVVQHERACGATPLDGWLLHARRQGLGATLLDLRTSGDTAGDKDQVVGYAAVAFGEAPHA